MTALPLNKHFNDCNKSHSACPDVAPGAEFSAALSATFRPAEFVRSSVHKAALSAHTGTSADVGLAGSHVPLEGMLIITAFSAGREKLTCLVTWRWQGGGGRGCLRSLPIQTTIITEDRRKKAGFSPIALIELDWPAGKKAASQRGHEPMGSSRREGCHS